MNGLSHLLAAYAPANFNQSIQSDIDPLNSTVSSGLNQCLPHVNEQFQHMLDIRKKIFDIDINSTNGVEETPEELRQVESAITTAKQYYQQMTCEFLSSTEQIEDAQRYLTWFKSNVKGAESLEDVIMNAVKLPENIRDLFMQHMSLLKPIEKDITKELEEYLSSLEEKKKSSAAFLKTLSGVFNAVQELSGYRSCPVCLSQEVSHYLIPCGHTFCTRCLDKHKGFCFICRKNIASTNRLYFS
jgi:small-conductance mechanosensitive channel